jgi:hypothetical protein
MQQFRVLLGAPGWEREECRAAELLRVAARVGACYLEEGQQLARKDFYALRSMCSTALCRLEGFYRESRQLEGGAGADAQEEQKRAELAQLQALMAACAQREEIAAK